VSRPARLVVVAGPANSGKMPLGRRLLSEDRGLVLVHRDHLRDAFEINRPDEWEITLLMGQLVRGILELGRSPLVVAWNLDPADRTLWFAIAAEYRVACEWLDVREPEIAALIPPLPSQGTHADV
jgi:hypothetical protein